MHVDEDGTIRVGKTRITLDVLVGDYRRGMTPKQIVEQLDSLTLADVYGALAHYHRHKDELDAYRQDRADDSARRQREIEDMQPTFDRTKSRILARRTATDASANTMTAHACDRVRQGLGMAGVIVLAEDIQIGKAIQELGTLAQSGDPGDLDGQILFLA